LKRETIKACFTKASFSYDGTNGTHEIRKLDEHIKENISEINITVGEDNVNDFLMVDTNLVTESQVIYSQNEIFIFGNSKYLYVRHI